MCVGHRVGGQQRAGGGGAGRECGLPGARRRQLRVAGRRRRAPRPQHAALLPRVLTAEHALTTYYIGASLSGNLFIIDDLLMLSNIRKMSKIETFLLKLIIFNRSLFCILSIMKYIFRKQYLHFK